MAKLTLKFDARELKECVVGAQPVSIGRRPDNVIVIDHPVVSGRHARVFREGKHYVIEDLKSTNGTFVNEKPIARHTLFEGDVVLVGKHSLVFSFAGGEDLPTVGLDDRVPETTDALTLDPRPPRSLLGNADTERALPLDAVIPKTAIPLPPQRHGSVRVLSGKSERSEYVLTAMTTIIGKTENALIKTPGWFKPKLSAAIARKGDGFTVSPMGASVSVNRQKVTGRQDLRDGDLIEVSGLTLEFKLV